MGELLACRVCLTTNVNLYDINKHKLNTVYENLMGCKSQLPVVVPQYICGVCGTLLMKFIAFKQKCQRSLKLLLYAYGQDQLVTTEYVTNLQAKSSLLSNFSINRKNISITEHQIKTKSESWFKDEGAFHDDTDIFNRDSDCTDDVDTKFEDSDDIETSDKESLSNKKDRKKKPNKFNVQNESSDDVSDFLEDTVEYQDAVENIDCSNIEVTVLTKEEQILEVKARMASLNYNNSLYKCELCYKGFLTKTTYKNHMERHDPSKGRHACDVCHARFSKARYVRDHVRNTHARRYECKLCAFVAKHKQKATEHAKWHGGHKFICKICDAQFDKSTSHLSHVRIHHPSEHFCNVCGESFIGEYGLEMHKKKAHKADVNDETTELMMCLRCDVSFHTAEALRTHSDYYGDCTVDVRPCVQCGESFDTNESLKEHLKTHSKEQPMRCEECDRSFANEHSFAGHYQTVHLGVSKRSANGQKIVCARSQKIVCARSTGVVCEICGKKCITRAALIYHQRTHTGEKPYACTECPKMFRVYENLKIHLRTHTGEAPYKCKNCPKSFKRKDALNRHDRRPLPQIHTGEKPYSCSHCGRCFSQSNSVKTHVRTVHFKLPEPYKGRQNRAEKRIRAETTKQLSKDQRPTPATRARAKRTRPAHSVDTD